MHEYESTRRVVYGDEGATFIPVCPTCGRYVKADDEIRFRDFGFGGYVKEPNATCSKCGRVEMPFVGYY